MLKERGCSNYTNGKETGWTKIDANNIHYSQLNQTIRRIISEGIKKIELHNVYGQRYLGTNLYPYDTKDLQLKIYGTPGNDTGVFLNGPTIEVFGNVQDACGNTMNAGEIVVHGNAGDILGYAMRGGNIYIKGNVGYRVAIHMKEYKNKVPVIVIGGTMQDFFGEYMAGGIVILLALDIKEHNRHSCFVGTGMHGGKIFVRGKMYKDQLGKEVGINPATEDELKTIAQYVKNFCAHFSEYKVKEIMDAEFIKLYPKHLRPYGKLYTY